MSGNVQNQRRRPLQTSSWEIYICWELREEKYVYLLSKLICKWFIYPQLMDIAFLWTSSPHFLLNINYFKVTNYFHIMYFVLFKHLFHIILWSTIWFCCSAYELFLDLFGVFFFMFWIIFCFIYLFLSLVVFSLVFLMGKQSTHPRKKVVFLF